jgi:hypothetical protein
MTYVFPLIAAPNFVSSMSQGDFVYFFFRETAVEYMNCGKVRKSAVADLVRADSQARRDRLPNSLPFVPFSRPPRATRLRPQRISHRAVNRLATMERIAPAAGFKSRVSNNALPKLSPELAPVTRRRPGGRRFLTSGKTITVPLDRRFALKIRFRYGARPASSPPFSLRANEPLSLSLSLSLSISLSVRAGESLGKAARRGKLRARCRLIVGRRLKSAARLIVKGCARGAKFLAFLLLF